MKKLSARLPGRWQLTHDYYLCKQDGIITEESRDLFDRDFMDFYDDATGNYRHSCVDWELSGNRLQIVRAEDDYATDMVVERLTCEVLVVSKSDHYVEDGITCDEYYCETYKRMN